MNVGQRLLGMKFGGECYVERLWTERFTAGLYLASGPMFMMIILYNIMLAIFAEHIPAVKHSRATAEKRAGSGDHVVWDMHVLITEQLLKMTGKRQNSQRLLERVMLQHGPSNVDLFKKFKTRMRLLEKQASTRVVTTVMELSDGHALLRHEALDAVSLLATMNCEQQPADQDSRSSSPAGECRPLLKSAIYQQIAQDASLEHEFREPQGSQISPRVYLPHEKYPWERPVPQDPLAFAESIVPSSSMGPCAPFMSGPPALAVPSLPSSSMGPSCPLGLGLLASTTGPSSSLGPCAPSLSGGWAVMESFEQPPLEGMPISGPSGDAKPTVDIMNASCKIAPPQKSLREQWSRGPVMENFHPQKEQHNQLAIPHERPSLEGPSRQRPAVILARNLTICKLNAPTSLNIRHKGNPASKMMRLESVSGVPLPNMDLDDIDAMLEMPGFCDCMVDGLLALQNQTEEAGNKDKRKDKMQGKQGRKRDRRHMLKMLQKIVTKQAHLEQVNEENHARCSEIQRLASCHFPAKLLPETQKLLKDTGLSLEI
ncbi:hypothetical protein CYMTET_21926 [Cymbomonas tetramitiformis]|uniref:Uncharacterized protein n=1 Tax=Cymbomonas tetramitiformis TaxID=36881 RepID=A0AAE0G0Z7_9CHLO|nr:hypothetical protein CYMTET_21926 [Cymbomonas tetramitiformis]